MNRIIWLASYPKSGNTWLRVLLTNYICNEFAPADINKAKYGTIASSRTWFDEWAGVEASALDDASVERLRPGVYRCMAREEQNTLYMKVHDAWNLTDRGEGIFPADITAGVVYILRNPLDMAASCANHWGLSVEKAVEVLCDPEYSLSRTLGGMSDQLLQKLGSWSSHVSSWLDESGLPVNLVRYEDLKRDPLAYFGEVVRFCGLLWDEDRIRRAVAFSAFGELQRQEQANDFVERSPWSPKPFFRRGEVGGWRDELSPHLVQRVVDMHGDTMRRFGYLDENNQPL